MQPSPSDAGEYYIWKAPDQPFAVHLHLDVVDRMLAEVMRGFGAVPKRGAEVGGILIGSIESGQGEDDPTIIRIEDFEQVPCAYRLGPSFLFTDEERGAFEAVAERWQDPAPGSYAVGYFRSNTREEMGLGQEDVQLMDHFFPDPHHVALLIQPYATKVSQAGFFLRGGDGFPGETPLAFPFRRREMLGEAPPPRRSLFERKRRSAAEAPSTGLQSPAAYESLTYGSAGTETYPEEDLYDPQGTRAAYAAPARRADRWSWVPLSTIFLLLGIAVGVWAALMMGPRLAETASPRTFALNLSADRTGSNLTVRWDREAAAIKIAQSGVLEIEDGGYTKAVDLRPDDLKSGNLIYQPAGTSGRFRLVLYLDSRLTVAESLAWSQ